MNMPVIQQIITDSAGVPLSGASMTLARNLIARLEHAYPAFTGYWRVSVNEVGGTIEVTNLMLSGRMGFLMHIAKIDPEGRKVVRAGGELLERYRVARSGAFTKVIEGVFEQSRDFRGELVADHG
jgi:hypothetical protein